MALAVPFDRATIATHDLTFAFTVASFESDLADDELPPEGRNRTVSTTLLDLRAWWQLAVRARGKAPGGVGVDGAR